MTKLLTAAALLSASALAAPRGVMARPRAEAPTDPKALFAELNKTFEDFKAKNDEQIDAKFKDVVRSDEIEKINSHLATIQSAMEEQARKLEAAATGADGGRTVKDPEYSKAFASYMRTEDTAVQASLKKTPDSDGGFLAPVEWDRTVTDKLKIVSPARQVFDVQPVSGQGMKKVFNLRGLASGWVGETAARPETNTATFGSMTYTFGELYANPAITQQMLDDSELDLEAWLASEIDTEFAFQEAIASVSGDGANKPTGLLTYVTGGTNAGVHPLGSIAYTPSTSAGVLPTGTAGADVIMDLIYSLPTEMGQNASMIANRNTIKTIRKLKDGQGNYLWQPSFQAGEPATIAGYACREFAAMPDIAANALPLAFGDLKRSYALFDRKGMLVLRDPYTNKPFVHFYTTKRVGGGLLNPEFVKLLKIAVS
jgi:HK97 family phage major capsid protein